ncbi:MAG TPA: helix-turn-helix transcriptional regulator [Ktedonobacterales bacterium]|jgi:transcriptional regulator with XRE-family HTH domain|nr:helix-turn-helix transcriptional regulator [Ktedonobacterales bacterium]
MADLQETVGTVIRRERSMRHLTMKELAERSAISVVYLGEIERGKKYPSSIVLERLAEALDMEVYDLLQLVAEELRAVMEPEVQHAIGFTPRRAATPEANVGAGAGLSRVVNLLEPVRIGPATPEEPRTLTVIRNLVGAVA